MREYRLLFCFANNIDTVIARLSDYGLGKGYSFQINHITNYSSLALHENLDLYDCVIIQEFFNAENPITIEYLDNFTSNFKTKIICIFDELKREAYAKSLYEKGFFSCFFGDDAAKLSIDEFADIVINGRDALNAKKYYNIKSNNKESYMIKSFIDKIIKISELYEEDEDMFIDETESMIKGFSDFELRTIVAQLPSNILEKLLCIPKFFTQYQYIKENILNQEKKKKLISLDVGSKHDIRLIPVNSKNIGVINLSRGAGATFFTMNFAKAISDFMKVSVIELPILEPYIYYYLGLNSLCSEGLIEFNSYAHIIDENESLSSDYYVHGKNNNLYWLVTDASKHQIDNWDETKMMRLLYLPKPSSLNIVDLGDKIFDDSVFKIIEQFYMIFVIVDPMIPNVLNRYDYLEKIKKMQKDKKVQVEYIINKYDSSADIKDLIKFLDVKPISYVPYINQKGIYKAVYNADLPYNNSSVKSELYKSFNNLLKTILPKEIYEQGARKNKKIKIGG